MVGLLRPLGCYEVTITQGGQEIVVIHRCASRDCPINQGG